jgi:hypothetical protein
MDKQVATVSLEEVADKVARDSAINAKEGAAFYGLSYQEMRLLVERPTFPKLASGRFFPSDFVLWRRQQMGLGSPLPKTPAAPSSPPLPKRLLAQVAGRSGESPAMRG